MDISRSNMPGVFTRGGSNLPIKKKARRTVWSAGPIPEAPMIGDRSVLSLFDRDDDAPVLPFTHAVRSRHERVAFTAPNT